MNRTAVKDSASSSAHSANRWDVGAVRGASADFDPGPDPRVTFANERTFLAWTRTSLALIGAGLAVAQLLKLGARVAPLLTGIGLIALGSTTSIMSYRQYRRNQLAIRHGQPIPTCAMPHVLAGGAALFAVLATVLAVLAFLHR